MAQYLLFIPVFLALGVIGWVGHVRKREFDEMYKMFGTTFDWVEDRKRDAPPKFPPFK